MRKLLRAIKNNNIEEFQIALQKISSKKLPDKISKIFIKTLQYGFEEASVLLIDKMNNDEFNKLDRNQNTFLMNAADLKRQSVCLKLINVMSDEAINHRNAENITAIWISTSKGLQEVTEKLLPKTNKDNITFMRPNGESLLVTALVKGEMPETICLEIAKLMSTAAINIVIPINFEIFNILYIAINRKYSVLSDWLV